MRPCLLLRGSALARPGAQHPKDAVHQAPMVLVENCDFFDRPLKSASGNVVISTSNQF
jgi:hypothetical protein